MGDRIRLALSAAFYLIALAATVGGFISQWFALLLAAIATVLLVWAAYHYGGEWHRTRNKDGKRGLDSWYFIAPCLALAMIAIAGAAYGLGLRAKDEVVATKENVEGGSRSKLSKNYFPAGKANSEIFCPAYPPI